MGINHSDNRSDQNFKVIFRSPRELASFLLHTSEQTVEVLQNLYLLVFQDLEGDDSSLLRQILDC